MLHTILNEKLSLDFIRCNEHKKELKDVIQKITKLFLYTFCKIVNRILSGRDTRYISTNIIFQQAIEHYKKKQKRFITKL